MLEKASEFIRDVRVESTKVTWPSRKELRESTMVVIVTVTLISMFIAVVDRVVTQVVTLII